MSEDVRVLYQGRFLQFLDRHGWEFINRQNVSAIVAIVAEVDGKLLFVEQYRAAIDSRAIEFPAGLVGDIAGCEDEDLFVAANRELEEETGYRAESFCTLTCGPASAGLSSEMITILQANGLQKVGCGGGDENEDITVHAVPIKQVPAWLKEQENRGLVVDLKVYTGLYFFNLGLAPNRS